MNEPEHLHPSITHYTLGSGPVTGEGLGVTEEELEKVLSGAVAALVFDDSGSNRLNELLEGLTDTDFARENLESLVSAQQKPEDWRVGEALAESYLVECQSCHFPWPDGRDERKRGSSLPGADLVGFHCDGDVERFAFGEVKTSSEATYPPSIAYSRHGLKKQMEDLRDRQDIRDGLVRYLAYRAENASWYERFKAACILYLRDTCDVRVFGLLVRDVPPKKKDLSARVNKLAQGCPSATTIQLLAIYLPEGKIATLSSKVIASRPRGGAT